MQEIKFSNFNLGGLSDSEYQGKPNSLYEMIGVDIISNSGLVQAGAGYTALNSDVLGGYVLIFVASSIGIIKFYNNGAIYGTPTSHTISGATYTGAIEYNGFIYFSYGTTLGRYEIATGTWTDSWQTFSNTADIRPMFVLNGNLYIGNGNYVALVDDTGAFTDNALDVPKEYKIISLCSIGTDLVIGTRINDNVCQSRIFRWDTWSVSWTADIVVYENGVNAMVQMDNGQVLVQAGDKASLYIYNGDGITLFKKFNYATSHTAKSNHYAIAQYNGRYLIGYNDYNSLLLKTGSIATVSRFSNDYPLIVNGAYALVGGAYYLEEVKSFIVYDGYLYISDSNAPTKYYSLSLDFGLRQSGGYIKTRDILLNRGQHSSATLRIFGGHYGCGDGYFTVLITKNYTVNETLSMIYDSDRNMCYSEFNIDDIDVLQVKITFNNVNANFTHFSLILN